MDHYKLNKLTGEVTKCGQLEWALWFESADRTIKRTTFIGNDGFEIVVSTVFLGIDHRLVKRDGPPILFETMIFVRKLDGTDDFDHPYSDAMWRYTTMKESIEHHYELIEAVQQDKELL